MKLPKWVGINTCYRNGRHMSALVVCQGVHAKSIIKVDLPFPLKNSDFPLLFWFNAREYYSLRVTWRDLSPTCFTQESPLLTSWVQSLFRATFMHFILALHLFVMISTQKIPKDPIPQLQKLHYLMDVTHFLPENKHVLSFLRIFLEGSSQVMSMSHLWCLLLYLGLYMFLIPQVWEQHT